MQIGAASSGVERAGPPAEMIFGEWYPALRADGLRARDAVVTTLLGIRMLVGRKGAGRAVDTLVPGAAGGAGVAEVWWALSVGAPFGGAALQCGSRDYRVDGSSAWAVCAPGVVVAKRGQHSREDETV